MFFRQYKLRHREIEDSRSNIIHEQKYMARRWKKYLKIM